MTLPTKSIPYLALAILFYACSTFAADGIRESAVLDLFKELKATSYSHKAKFSKAVPDVYLAYDKDGKVIAGAALRNFKTYETVTSMVVIIPKDGAYIIFKADIPDVYLIKDDKKLMKVVSAVKAADGKTVKTKTGKSLKVDAVSGATRYQKRLYANFSLLSRKVVEQMLGKPGWTKKPLE